MQKRSLKRLIKRLLLILIPAYLIWFVYIECMPMYFNQANNTRWYFIKECLDGNISLPKTNILFLGESRVNAAVDFTEFPHSFSFASGGSTSIEMYYILKKYIDRYGRPDTVFLSISPRFLSEVFAFYPYAVRNDLFTFSEFKEIMNHSEKNDTTLGKFPFFKFGLYKLNYIEYYQSDVMNNFVFGAKQKNEQLIQEMTDLRGGRIHPGLQDSCSNLNYETNYEHFIPSPVIDVYLNMVLSLCRSKDIFLIFEFVPMNESSYRRLYPDFIVEYKSYMKKIKESYQEFQISDSIYYYRDSFFGDESHLNSKGKKKYTAYLKSVYF